FRAMPVFTSDRAQRVVTSTGLAFRESARGHPIACHSIERGGVAEALQTNYAFSRFRLLSTVLQMDTANTQAASANISIALELSSISGNQRLRF
ncbi:MAG TPA: hypothetical protein VG498_25770, partial [Terriglobales bacterium]|nr:hypothetical protein [Terriglobales bacterium]